MGLLGWDGTIGPAEVICGKNARNWKGRGWGAGATRMNVAGVAASGMPPVTMWLDMAILGWFVAGHGYLAT
nr:hypothetical protein Itr_chr02CG17790 [Ipomoea trifida]